MCVRDVCVMYVYVVCVSMWCVLCVRCVCTPYHRARHLFSSSALLETVSFFCCTHQASWPGAPGSRSSTSHLLVEVLGLEEFTLHIHLFRVLWGFRLRFWNSCGKLFHSMSYFPKPAFENLSNIKPASHSHRVPKKTRSTQKNPLVTQTVYRLQGFSD